MRELDASIADCGSVDNRGDFRHIFQAELVEKVGVVILQARQEDVFLEWLILASELV
jgi:hypothetical protein